MSRKKVDVQKVIQVHATPEHEGKGLWMHTHGMAELNHPDLEMRNIPAFLSPHACSLLNEICDYVINGGGIRIKAGERMQVGDLSRFQFMVAGPKSDEEKGHYETPRLEVVDVEFQCRSPDHQEVVKVH